jgi:hypothetical protein
MKGKAMETTDVNQEARVGVVGMIRGHQHGLAVAHQSHEGFFPTDGNMPDVEAVSEEPGREQM